MGFFSSRKAKKKEGSPPVHLLMVSHEATLTGAPKIALNLVQEIRQKCDVDLTTILHDGGPLHPDFDEVAPTTCIDVPRCHHPQIHKQIRKLTKKIEESGQQILCLCNSAESRFIANSIYTRNIPIVYLLHEFPTSYDPVEFQKIFEYSNHIVFPCETVRKATECVADLPAVETSVHSQGLLDPGFGSRYRTDNARRRLREKLNLPEDAFVVLGCGTIDLRKGFDHFVATARTCPELIDSDREIHFVWLGDGPRHPHSAFHYVEIDFKNSDRKNLHLIGEVSNVEPYFAGADTFLLTSRVDPFPCVVHEAMASSLPIILYEESGGAREAVGDAAGIPVSLGNYVATARALESLIRHPERALQIGKAGYDRVHAQYRFSDYADQIIAICENQLGQSIRRPESLSQVSLSQVPLGKLPAIYRNDKDGVGPKSQSEPESAVEAVAATEIQQPPHAQQIA